MSALQSIARTGQLNKIMQHLRTVSCPYQGHLKTSDARGSVKTMILVGGSIPNYENVLVLRLSIGYPFQHTSQGVGNQYGEYELHYGPGEMLESFPSFLLSSFFTSHNLC